MIRFVIVVIGELKTMSRNQLIKRFHALVNEGYYKGAISILERIKDKQTQIYTCFMALAAEGVKRAIEEHGAVHVLRDKEEFERAKIGLEDVSPYAVLHVDGLDNEGDVEGLEEMLDFVPDDNPLKQYYQELEQEA